MKLHTAFEKEGKVAMLKENKKINEIILHVGLHKTGTTSIQQTLFLKGNSNFLESKGYLYPNSWNVNHSIPVYNLFCDHPEKYHINIKNEYSIAEIRDINKRYLKRLEAEIVERDQTKLIISGEDISSLSLDNLIALKKYLRSISTNDVTIRVIIYVRNPITWSISAIQTMIKGGETYQNTFQHLSFILINLFRNNITKFVQVFGKEQVDIYTFEEAVAHASGPVGHFLSSLGFSDNEIGNFNIVRANESASQTAVDIMSFINEKLPMIRNGKLHEKRTNGDILPLLNIKGVKFDIPYSDKKKLFENSQDDVKWLKDSYGIDYSFLKEPQKNEVINEFTEETIMDIKKACFNPQLTPTMRGLILEYLQKKIINNSKDTIN
ncbi:hypothetical protein AB6A23_20745 [Paenibacillus tarimensis]